MILVVDDKPENILPLKKILEVNKFKVDSAASGEEALKKVLKNDYELIILDVQMPDMDGFEVAEALSGYSKSIEIPIIFLSAVATENSFIAKGYQSGAVDYVTKPVDPDLLILKVKTFCKLFKQTRELKELTTDLGTEVRERKNVQHKLQEIVSELNSVIESLPQIAFTLTPDGNVFYANKNWYEYSDSLNRFPEVYPSDNDKMVKLWKKGFDQKKEFECEVRIKKRSENKFKFHLLKVVPVFEKNKVVKWVGTFTDIDESKQIEKKKDEFIGIASHELKTPLTTIKAYFQLLERTLNSKTEPVKSYIHKTSEQLNKLTGLVADLLDISRTESGKMQFQKEWFSFHPLLLRTIETIEQIHPDYQIKVRNYVDVSIFADQNRIEQVLINYLTNAVKYSPHEKEIEIRSEIENGNLVVRVKDFGVGIAKEKQRNIFKKFFRAEESAERFQGLGIGLYICSEILKRHGGTYGVKSEPGKGSEFCFTLPLNPEKENQP